MNSTRLPLLLAFLLLYSFSGQAQIQVDSVAMTSDCMTDFFKSAEPVAKPAAIQLVTKTGKVQSLAAFEKANWMEQYGEAGLKDLDKDGKKELVLFNFTGGAHCCDEILFFKPVAPNKFQYVTELFGGNTCIDDSAVIHYDFTERYGYFYTCYACMYTDSTDEAPMPLSAVKLKYSKGKVSVIPGDKELRALINDNLAKLSEQPYQAIKGDDFDEGLRKEFAFNLAVFHYSFGKNLVETKKIFSRYYKFPDAAKVWKSFTETLSSIKGF